MTFWKWSQTAASNATADTTINAREGQAPSTVNDAMRAMMAASAKYRDDTSGNLVTAGSSTAYTLTTNQSLTSLTDGFAVTCRMSATNGAAPTLNLDSLGAKSIAGVYGTAIPIGALQSGGVYTFVYDSTDDKWICHGIGSASHLTPTDGNIIVGDGSGWVTESGATARTSLGLGTGDSPEFTAVNIGAATDTTIARVSAGRISVEGVNVVTISSTDTLTNKTINLTSNTLAATSAQIAAAVTDETGSGALVFATSPTLVTPALGTPSSGTLSSCTGLPLTTGVTGTLPVANGGTGVTTSTGTGNVVLSASPTLTGSPIAPTQSAATENTTIATTAFVWGTLGAPSGTKMTFRQTAAPTGWTKDTTYTDAAFRVTSGTISEQATAGKEFSTLFAARTIAEANLPSHTHGAGTLATASDGAHTHTVSSTTGGTFVVEGGSGDDWTNPGAGLTIGGGAGATAASNGAHTHTISGSTGATGSGTAMDFAVNFVDLIIATRN